MSLFQQSVIKKYITGIESDQIENAYQKFKANFSPEKIEIQTSGVYTNILHIFLDIIKINYYNI